MKTQLILFSLLFLVSCGKATIQETPNYENETLKDQIGELKQTISDSSKEIAFLNVDVIRLEAEIAQGLIDSQQSSDTLQIILNNLRAQIELLNARIEELEKANESLTQCEKPCKMEKEDKELPNKGKK